MGVTTFYFTFWSEVEFNIYLPFGSSTNDFLSCSDSYLNYILGLLIYYSLNVSTFPVLDYLTVYAPGPGPSVLYTFRGLEDSPNVV